MLPCVFEIADVVYGIQKSGLMTASTAKPTRPRGEVPVKGDTGIGSTT